MGAVPGYKRHQPEQALLYLITERYQLALIALMERQGNPLPGYVQKEFEDDLKCGRL